MESCRNCDYNHEGECTVEPLSSGKYPAYISADQSTYYKCRYYKPRSCDSKKVLKESRVNE